MFIRSLVLFLLLLAIAIPVSAKTLAEIRASGELVFGTDATYPPFETVGQSGRFEGFDIDLGTAIASELGLKVRWINSNFDGIFPALAADKFDLVISSVTSTAERRQAMEISAPYYDAGQVIIVRKGKPRIERSELANQRVGVQISTTAQYALEKDPSIELRKYPDIASALLDLQNGRLAAVVNDLPTSRYMLLKTFHDLEIAGDPFTKEQYGICGRSGSRELIEAVNQALAVIKADGRYHAIYRKWFGTDPVIPKETRWQRFLSALPELLVTGVSWTVILTGLGLFFGIPLGLLVGLLRIAPVPWLSHSLAIWVEATRGTPLLVQIFTIYYVLPSLGISLVAFPAAVLALALNAGAYISEIFRAGILSIPQGQMEAARSLGLSWPNAMQTVIVPQALKRVVPPLSNEAIALLKDSSLVMVMGMTELTRRGQEMTSATADPLAIWPAVALCYLLLTLPLTALARYLEKRWSY
ncbi:MAG: ABC transporter permease subunit [Cyanobacteria bacterium NC_groundwater_1444_Ag_S-0.65um_54_12]|nr:ABC transporter permease subunit [Cyanobacteria bacterium NC_groundwater_1444_Ag_S-0.65um_54_12]